MKKILTVFFVVGVLLTAGVLAQDRATAKVAINGKNIEIEYGTPSLQGRDMLSRLPVGGTWRMCMNAATTLKTDGALSIGGETIAAGEYTLTAKRVEEEKWHLIIAQGESKIEVPLTGEAAGSSVETFKIDLTSKGGNAGQFTMAWGSMKQGTGFTVE
ncbi:MAG: DUF2911 domain-containing protein [Acidobacteriota bacterium]|nr:MAG: DUF2911 domain-containing protein [Acidobacteriota bacterium]